MMGAKPAGPGEMPAYIFEKPLFTLAVPTSLYAEFRDIQADCGPYISSKPTIPPDILSVGPTFSLRHDASFLSGFLEEARHLYYRRAAHAGALPLSPARAR